MPKDKIVDAFNKALMYMQHLHSEAPCLDAIEDCDCRLADDYQDIIDLIQQIQKREISC